MPRGCSNTVCEWHMLLLSLGFPVMSWNAAGASTSTCDGGNLSCIEVVK